MTNDFEVLMSGQPFKRLAEQLYGPLMERSGLRKVELDILYCIAHAGLADTARDIMERRHFSKAHISKSVDHLKKLGYIEIQTDPEDRRYLHLHTTPMAQPILKDLETLRATLRATLFKGITPEEREAVSQVLTKIVHNLRDASASGEAAPH
ncbi:MarR family winged helix-turn-helix transcriptional regulator [Eubacterium aggregans]|uniref:MarR family winged helix-turn-helix transcriptional regulator n=1 Tax=Eubacterium aggregans TaxID=81409 RepID=UPI0023F28FDF|nr:MarR family winged helix-turn-helix transcriptional regulator [Eubacterium aggregans]MDD4691791.1 MarR family winged helix-turn-helix transcriptional regulator [Eubacterium aggregans]